MGGDTAARSNYLWMAHSNIDVVLSGHMHLPDHVTALNDADRTINYATMSSSGDSLTTSITGGACASRADCTPVWGSTPAGGRFTNTYMAGRLTITDTQFKIEYFSYLNWNTPVHTITLTKAPPSVIDACADVTKVCFNGGLRFNDSHNNHCFVLSGLTLTGQSLDLFDQYGGAKNLPCPTGATAHWYVEKISNRWWFCTPDGNAFWLHSVWNVNSSSSTSRAGVRLGGSLNSAAPRMAVQARRIRTWGSMHSMPTPRDMHPSRSMEICQPPPGHLIRQSR